MRPLTALVLSAPLFAQVVGLGLRAGISATAPLSAGANQHASVARFTVGPAMEVHLGRGAALGLDWLFDHSEVAALAASARLHHAEIWRWQLPVTVLYRFEGRFRPIVRTGLAFNRVFRIGEANECGRGPFGERFYCIDSTPVAELRHTGTVGFVIGGGLQRRLIKLRLQPEVRLTRWMDRNFGVRDSPVRSNPSQINLLLGVIF